MATNYQENIGTLLYSPSVTVYVGHKTGFGTYAYYDLSQDIVSCSVNRTVDSCSSFSFMLQNHKGKYNGLFEPMDLCTIYAQKEGKLTRLITGYITNVPQYRSRGDSLPFSGKCSLYRLQQTWWDPHLKSSQTEMLLRGNPSAGGSYEQMLLNLLTGVGGMDVGDVVIGKIPPEVQEWAYAMYEAKQDSMGQSVSQLDEFYDILMTTGITGGSSSDTSSAASSVGGGSAGVEAAVSWAEAVAAESPRRVHYSMDRRTWIDKNPGYVDCSAFVWYSLQKNGWEQVDGFRKGTWPMTTVTESATLKKGGFDTFDWDGNDISVLQRGDIVYYDSGGGAHGHTEWYCGDGYFCGSRGGKGPIKTKGLSTTKMRHYCRYMGNDIVDAQVESQGGAGGKVGPCAYNSSDSYWDGTTKRNTSYGIGLENDGYNGAIAGANFKQDEKTYGFAALTNNNGLFASRKKYPYGTIVEVGQTKKDSSGKNRAMRVVLCDWGTGGSDRRDMDFQCAPYNYITENGKLSASNLKYKVVSKGKGYNSFKYKDLIP